MESLIGRSKGWKRLRKPEENRGKYWAKNMMRVKGDRFKKGQISFAHKALVRKQIHVDLQSD